MGSTPAGRRESGFSGRGACACDALPKGGEASTQRCRRCFGGGKFCRHDDVDRRQFELREAKRFAHQPAQTIAPHGVAGRFHGDGEPDAGKSQAVGFDAQPEEAIVDAASGSIDGVELRLATQAQFGTESKATRCGVHGEPQIGAGYGTIFLRPLERRRERTFWPPFVFMRARNPVARLRRSLLG